MSFSSNVKSELCKIGIDECDVCCRRAELAGIICFAAQMHVDGIRVATEHVSVAKRIYMLYKSLYSEQISINIKKTPRRTNHTYSMFFPNKQIEGTLGKLCFSDGSFVITEAVTGSDCCARAFIKGAFLGGGSISTPEKGYHTEIVTSHESIAPTFALMLEQQNVPPKHLKRKNNHVFYIKDSEEIGDFLIIIGAPTKMMELLNIKIWKEMRNNTNRLVNAENANIDKTVNAAQKQLEAIHALEQSGRLAELKQPLRELAYLRINNPELSLTELGELLPRKATKSTVYYRMAKLMAEAQL